MLNKIKHPLIILLFFIIGCFIFKDTFFAVYDTPRELLIPKGILEGKILYKEIYNFYGALPYYIAALFFKIFGLSTNSYFSLNIINSLFFVFGIYFLANLFVNKKYSLITTIFVMCTTIFNITIFNFIYPYSICYTFALSAYIYSILFLIKFIKENNDKYFIISSVLLGFCVASKNEFILTPLIHIISIFLYKTNKFKYLIRFLLCFSIFPLLQMLILFISGLKFEDLPFIFSIFIKSTTSTAMKEFHKGIGMYPFLLKPLSLIKIILCWIGIICSCILYRRNKIYGTIILIILLLFIKHNIIGSLLFFLPLTVFLLLILKIKVIIKKPAFFVLILGALLTSLKTFFYLNFTAQGAYAFPLFILYFIALFVANRKTNIIMFLIPFFITFYFYSSCIAYFEYSNIISHNQITTKTTNTQALLLENIVSWINNNTKDDEKILMFPEFTTPLLMTNRQSDYMFYNLHDISIDILGTDYIRKRVLDNKIKYIIDTSSYNSYLYNVKSYKIVNEGKFIETTFKDKFKKIHQINVKNYKINIYKKIL